MNWITANSNLILAVLAVLVPTATGFWATIKWLLREIAKVRQDGVDREKACVERLQATEDSRHQDALQCIGKNTEAFMGLSASNRELSAAVDRMSIAVADMPGQADPAATRRKLQARADDITPQAHPIVRE